MVDDSDAGDDEPISTFITKKRRSSESGPTDKVSLLKKVKQGSPLREEKKPLIVPPEDVVQELRSPTYVPSDQEKVDPVVGALYRSYLDAALLAAAKLKTASNVVVSKAEMVSWLKGKFLEELDAERSGSSGIALVLKQIRQGGEKDVRQRLVESLSRGSAGKQALDDENTRADISKHVVGCLRQLERGDAQRPLKIFLQWLLLANEKNGHAFLADLHPTGESGLKELMALVDKIASNRGVAQKEACHLRVILRARLPKPGYGYGDGDFTADSLASGSVSQSGTPVTAQTGVEDEVNGVKRSGVFNLNSISTPGSNEAQRFSTNNEMPLPRNAIIRNGYVGFDNSPDSGQTAGGEPRSVVPYDPKIQHAVNPLHPPAPSVRTQEPDSPALPAVTDQAVATEVDIRGKPPSPIGFRSVSVSHQTSVYQHDQIPRKSLKSLSNAVHPDPSVHSVGAQPTSTHLVAMPSSAAGTSRLPQPAHSNHSGYPYKRQHPSQQPALYPSQQLADYSMPPPHTSAQDARVGLNVRDIPRHGQGPRGPDQQLLGRRIDSRFTAAAPDTVSQAGHRAAREISREYCNNDPEYGNATYLAILDEKEALILVNKRRYVDIANYRSILETPTRADPRDPRSGSRNPRSAMRVAWNQVSHRRRGFLEHAIEVYRTWSLEDVDHLFADGGDLLDFDESCPTANRALVEEVKKRACKGRLHTILALHGALVSKMQEVEARARRTPYSVPKHIAIPYPRDLVSP